MLLLNTFANVLVGIVIVGAIITIFAYRAKRKKEKNGGE